VVRLRCGQAEVEGCEPGRGGSISIMAEAVDEEGGRVAFAVRAALG